MQNNIRYVKGQVERIGAGRTVGRSPATSVPMPLTADPGDERYAALTAWVNAMATAFIAGVLALAWRSRPSLAEEHCQSCNIGDGEQSESDVNEHEGGPTGLPPHPCAGRDGAWPVSADACHPRSGDLHRPDTAARPLCAGTPHTRARQPR
jgi:hypothetical protein